ncbi:MAG: UDP-2,3-diacylglucosamine diphosphatase LpxI [Rickettsiaceae bacterium]|nr:UDP-2,3-diacylglucosamine diphosphatase LpxI [Rickettsiaceae bacterium]
MRICVVAGKGDLPKEIIKKILSEGFFCCIIGVRGQHNLDPSQNPNFTELELGKIGAAISFCKSHNITHIVFAGSIKRPSLGSIIPDSEGAKLLTKIISKKFLGDDSLLKTILDFVEDRGFNILSPNEILNINSNSSGILTTTPISQKDLENIEIGCKGLAIMSPLDIGQSLIVSGNRIIAVEGAEGTDEMIKRSKDYTNEDAILVKIPKTGQDQRVDMPTIGPKTIDIIKKSNIKGLAIDKNVIILSQEETIEKADKNNIFIYVIK